jgi:hypothetical protein
MGLIIDVYRNAGRNTDCTLGGISSIYSEFTVVNIDGPFHPKSHRPAVFLEKHVSGCLRIVPAIVNDDGTYFKDPRSAMMGGNYAATSDSRFSEACEHLLGHRFYGAVAVHDRYEG